MELRLKASLNLYINLTNIFIRRCSKRAYVVSHKIKVKQSHKTEKKRKKEDRAKYI